MKRKFPDPFFKFDNYKNNETHSYNKYPHLQGYRSSSENYVHEWSIRVQNVVLKLSEQHLRQPRDLKRIRFGIQIDLLSAH
mgnify:CR=1 FL=1